MHRFDQYNSYIYLGVRCIQFVEFIHFGIHFGLSTLRNPCSCIEKRICVQIGEGKNCTTVVPVLLSTGEVPLTYSDRVVYRPGAEKNVLLFSLIRTVVLPT